MVALHRLVFSVSTVRVFTSDALLLWQTALHYLQRRHILQLPKQVTNGVRNEVAMNEFPNGTVMH